MKKNKIGGNQNRFVNFWKFTKRYKNKFHIYPKIERLVITIKINP